MADPPNIAGAPVVLLQAEPPARLPAIVRAAVAPGRGMLLLQAWARLEGGDEVALLDTPPLHEAAALLNRGGEDDFAGNLAFSLGGAILLPYANRIQGRDVPGAREIEVDLAGETLRLPRNWGGRAPGARRYAMHGLMLDRSVPITDAAPTRLTGRLQGEDFDGRWPSRWDLRISWRLRDGSLTLEIEAKNTGAAPSPMGIGWHPWFRVLSDRREDVRLRLPAAARTAVTNYDEVLPTGEILPVAGTAYDFRRPRALGDLFLDDCFIDLERPRTPLVLEMRDPSAGLRLSLTSRSPRIAAVQVYAPRDRAVVVIEPQFNRPDPFSPVWLPGAETGMQLVAPGAAAHFDVRLHLDP